ncbi:sex peptide receptor-like [Mytilus trossulus]|uniref:sex peptide receptor-like n=1 Tax=Mytilus trossulus TaxID=6551 RepID=UPI0030042F69
MYPLIGESLYVLIIKPVLLVAVLSTNIIVVVAWLSPKNRSPVSIILSVIAFYDTATILFSTIYTISTYVAGHLLSVSGCYINHVAESFAFIFHSSSILTTTYLACQRCVICLFPFSGPRICGQKTTVLFSVVSFVFVTSVQIPFLLVRNIEGEVKRSDENGSVLYCKAPYIINKDIMDEIPDIIWLIRLFTLHLMPAFVVTFSMIACVLTVNRRKMVSGRSSDQRSKKKTTVMLVLVMLIFVLGEFPTTLGIFLDAFLPAVPNWFSTEDGIQFGNVVLVISFLLNILVYVGMSKQFRDSLKELLCRSTTEPSSS